MCTASLHAPSEVHAYSERHHRNPPTRCVARLTTTERIAVQRKLFLLDLHIKVEHEDEREFELVQDLDRDACNVTSHQAQSSTHVSHRVR